jgi:glycosyltransferase involved in cell wall biosynthesis
VSADDVLLIADGPGHVLDRLVKAWAVAWTRRRHRVVYSLAAHAYVTRAAMDGARLAHWIDPLGFMVSPSAAFVPQVVMMHHMTPAEIEPYVAGLRYADAITTSSRRWQRRLRELTGRDVTLIPYTLDTRSFVPRPDAAALRASLGIDPSTFVLGFSAKKKADAFGRKGIDLFLETLAAAAGRWSDLTLLLIGSGWDDLVPRIEALGCRVVNRIPETTEHTAGLYPAMDVFLCTSSEEGGPCTILEAMACGVPVVTTDVGHVPEVIADGVTGFIASERTPAPSLEAIAALRGDAALRARIAAEGRRFVEMERDHERVLPGLPYEEIYEEAARTFRSRTPRLFWRRSMERSILAARYAASRIRNRITY